MQETLKNTRASELKVGDEIEYLFSDQPGKAGSTYLLLRGKITEVLPCPQFISFTLEMDRTIRLKYNEFRKVLLVEKNGPMVSHRGSPLKSTGTIRGISLD